MSEQNPMGSDIPVSMMMIEALHRSTIRSKLGVCPYRLSSVTTFVRWVAPRPRPTPMIRLAPVFSCNCFAQPHTTFSSCISARPLHQYGPPLSYNAASAVVESFGRPEYGLGG